MGTENIRKLSTIKHRHIYTEQKTHRNDKTDNLQEIIWSDLMDLGSRRIVANVSER